MRCVAVAVIRWLAIGAAVAVAVTLGTAHAGQARQRPNVIFILSDDQNFDTIGAFGGKVLTPTLDRLAAQGVKFTRACSVSSVCTPSRYICLTGQHAARCQSESFLKNFPPQRQTNVGFNVQVTPGSYNVGRVLREAGYATGLVGKWHTGNAGILKYPPTADIRDPKVVKILVENQRRLSQYIRACGFDYAESLYRGNLDDHKLNALTHHNMEWVTQGALDFIDRYHDKPFYLQIAPTLQHSPSPLASIGGDPRLTPIGLLAEPPRVQAPRESIAPRLATAGISADMAHATWLDDAVAAVVKRLEERGIAENTVIIFFSDNATRGGKGTCFDTGVRTPALIYGPGRVPAATTCDKLIGNIDFVPTIFDLCGVTPPRQMHLDGRSFLPLLRGETSDWRDALYLEIGHSRGVATEKWKYIAVRYPPAMQKAIDDGTLQRPPYHMDTSLNLQERAVKTHPAYFDRDQLYDLVSDPGEQVNLAADRSHAKTLSDMKARLGEFLDTYPHPFGEFRK